MSLFETDIKSVCSLSLRLKLLPRREYVEGKSREQRLHELIDSKECLFLLLDDRLGIVSYCVSCPQI